jgi:coenzyme F420-reducing hydrogenase gamma subunit
MNEARPKVAVFKFSSCDGCQLAILCLEDELLLLAETVDIAWFLEARSRTVEGPYDVTFVEGSVTTPSDIERIRSIRQQSKYLIALGACATAGGIQALRNWADVETFTRAIYASPEHIRTLATSTPISDHVKVDFELHGCPVNKYEIVEVVASLLKGRAPHFPAHAVCIDCKRKGIACVMVSRELPCLGPVTRAGCDALCPSFDRGCFGCFGPAEMANPGALAGYLRSRRRPADEIVRRFRGFTGWAPPFRAVAGKVESKS